MNKTVAVIIAVMGTALIITGFTLVLVKAHRMGQATVRATNTCHARGAAYHYWQDRNRCVLYIR